jgi:hypothetical protein
MWQTDIYEYDFHLFIIKWVLCVQVAILCHNAALIILHISF